MKEIQWCVVHLKSAEKCTRPGLRLCRSCARNGRQTSLSHGRLRAPPPPPTPRGVRSGASGQILRVLIIGPGPAPTTSSARNPDWQAGRLSGQGPLLVTRGQRRAARGLWRATFPAGPWLHRLSETRRVTPWTGTQGSIPEPAMPLSSTPGRRGQGEALTPGLRCLRGARGSQG